MEKYFVRYPGLKQHGDRVNSYGDSDEGYDYTISESDIHEVNGYVIISYTIDKSGRDDGPVAYKNNIIVFNADGDEIFRDDEGEFIDV